MNGSDGGAPQADAIGSCGHVRHTLERARDAIRTSRARELRGHSLLARADALIEASQRRVGMSLPLQDEVHASVAAYARHLHDDGMPPERMLVSVKTTVRDAMSLALDPFEARDLMEHVVRWSIEAYYDAA